MDDSDDTTIRRTRSIQHLQHTVPISHPTPRHLHNIPLAPPATHASANAPSIEVVGKRTYRRPELRSGIQESDDLLSSIPDELRSRPLTSLHTSNNNHVHNTSTTTTNITTSNTHPINNTRHLIPSPSSPSLNGNNNSDSASIHSTTNQERQKSTTDTSDNDDDSPHQHGTQRYSSWSNASTGKSSGSFSLYSTFGPEASDSTLDLDQLVPELPIGKRSPSPPLSTIKKEETTATSHEADSDDDDSDSDDDDLFVDATGMSQEDMEREKRISSSSSKKRLSKRLSGGHFGSAGGLMLSTAADRNSTQELAELMMNWRRESIDISLSAAATLNKRPPSFSKTNPPSLTLSSGNNPPVPVAALSPPPRRKRSLHQLQQHHPSPPPPPSSMPPPPPPPQMPLPPAFTSSALPDPPSSNQPSSTLPPLPQSSASAPVVTQSNQKETAHEGEARFAAQHIWQGDESFIVKERAAEWLGQG